MFFDGGYSCSNKEGGAGYVLVRERGWEVIHCGATFSNDGSSNNVREYRDHKQSTTAWMNLGNCLE